MSGLGSYGTASQEREAPPVGSLSGISALGPFKSHVLAQCRALVLGSKQTARLQFRDDQRDKIVKPARQMRGVKQKAVDAVTTEPLLHVVNDLARRADQRTLSSGRGEALV